MSEASSTTHTTAGSRRWSAQIPQGSCSVRLPHTEQGVTRSETAWIARARRSIAAAGCFSRWYVSRVAVLRPMPGSLASSAVSSSMTDNRVSDRKLEWQREASRSLAELFLIHLARPPLRVAHRGQHEVLQHFGIGARQDA